MSPNHPHRAPILPDRIRRPEGGFAFIPNRFLHGGFFASLSHVERSLYPRIQTIKTIQSRNQTDLFHRSRRIKRSRGWSTFAEQNRSVFT
jgi:hypothetical protein